MSSLQLRIAHLEWGSDLQSDGRVGLPAVAYNIHCWQGGPRRQPRQRVGACHNMITGHRRAHCGTLGKEVTDCRSTCAVALQPLYEVCWVRNRYSWELCIHYAGYNSSRHCV